MDLQGSKFRIEPAKPADNLLLGEAISRIHYGNRLMSMNRDVRGDFFANANNHESSHVFVARVGDSIAGSVAGSIRNGLVSGSVVNLGYIYQLFVTPEYRRRGVAGALVKQAENDLVDRGADLVFLAVEGGNVAAKELFAGLGYDAVENIRRIGFACVKKKKRRIEHIRSCREEDLEDVFELINRTWDRHDFFHPYSRESFLSRMTRKTGFDLENILIHEESGKPVACVALWDSNLLSTIRVRRVSFGLRALGAISGFARPFAAIPSMPKVNGEMKSPMLLGMIGYRDAADFEMLFDFINNRMASQEPQLSFFLCEESSELPRYLKGVFRNKGHIQIRSKEIRPDIRVGGPVYADAFEIL